MTRPPYAACDPDRDYLNGDFIPGAAEYPARWAAAARRSAPLSAGGRISTLPMGRGSGRRWTCFFPKVPRGER